MKTQVLTNDGLNIYDKEIKNYIKEHGNGLTEADVLRLINVQISNDKTYEPLDGGE